MLNNFQNLVNELQKENGSNEKKEILKRYPQCKELLYWTLTSYKKFGITSDAIKKLKDLDRDFAPANIILLLEMLSSREITGHTAIRKVLTFIDHNKEYEDIIYRIIDKDLKCRCGKTLINSIYPGLIPEFKVALAEDYFKQRDINFSSEFWVCSRKLDGCRCICRIENGTIRFFSREGHEFFTLDNLKAAIRHFYKLGDCVLDGEICLVDEKTGVEDFQKIMKEIRRKDHTIKNSRYMVFDHLTLEEFDSGTSDRDLVARHYDSSLYNSDAVKIVEQSRITSKELLLQLLDEVVERGWEGLILRKSGEYKGKRSSDLLKVKKMHEAEYVVLATITGEIDDGQGNKVEGLSAVIIDHKGNNVRVGSGFTFKERIEYYNDSSLIIGKIITVKFFEETTNQQGEHSLRFPILKAIHGEKRIV